MKKGSRKIPGTFFIGSVMGCVVLAPRYEKYIFYAVL